MDTIHNIWIPYTTWIPYCPYTTIVLRQYRMSNSKTICSAAKDYQNCLHLHDNAQFTSITEIDKTAMKRIIIDLQDETIR